MIDLHAVMYGFSQDAELIVQRAHKRLSEAEADLRRASPDFRPLWACGEVSPELGPRYDGFKLFSVRRRRRLLKSAAFVTAMAAIGRELAEEWPPGTPWRLVEGGDVSNDQA